MASRPKIIFASLLLAFSLALISPAYSADTKVKYKADNVSYEKGPKKVTLRGNVSIDVDYVSKGEDGKDLTEKVNIIGEQIDVDLEKKIISTEKKYKITTKKFIKGKDRNISITGTNFEFNVDIKRLISNTAYIEIDADAEGQKARISGDQVNMFNNGERITVVKGDFTTCDVAEEGGTAHYNIKGDNIDFYPGDRLIGWNTSIYFGGNKTYWYPFFYYPMAGNNFENFNLDTGKNSAEGYFINFKNYYQFNDYHDGNWYLRLMEKKVLGVGFDHTWIANPTSISNLYFYGNPVNLDYFQSPNPDIRKTTNPIFDDHEIYLSHQQWIPILPHAQTNLTYNKRRFYNINSLLSPKDDFSNYGINFKDSEIFQPLQGLKIEFNPTITADLEDRLNSNIDQVSGLTTLASKNRVTKLGTVTNLKINDIGLDLNTNFTDTVRNDNLIQKPNQESFYKAADNIDFRNTLNLTYNEILPGLSFNASSNYTNTNNTGYTKPTLTSLGSVSYGLTQDINQNLNTKATLSQNLNWGSLSLSADHFNDFLDKDIIPRDNSGNIIPINQLSKDQTDRRNTSIDKRRASPSLTKLPELNLTLNPFFKDYFPVTLGASVGRYLESASYPKNNTTGLLDLVRSNVKMNFDSRDLDLGLGNKINFGGTGYEQSLYQTQDAQYKFTGQMSYKNDLSQYFIPNLTYYKVITDDQNNSPFSFDRFSRDRQDKLTSGLSIGNIPEFTFNLGNIGYDYLNKTYFNPNISVNSEFVAGLRFSVNAQTSYNVNNITKQSLIRPAVDIATGQAVYADKNKLRYDLARLGETDFSSLYSGYSKVQAQIDANSLNEEALKAKYSIDNRLYDSTGKTVVNNTRLTERDIGSLELRGGKFAPLTLSVGMATPWEFGSDGDFGKNDIPWGFATSLTTNYDFQAEDFYKPKRLYGITTAITETQRNYNFLQKFASNTSLSTLLVIGGNWFSHTNIRVDLSLIPPEQVADGGIATQTNKPFLPVNAYISIKKDLHDFILSFDFQNQYVSQFNKQDFMFSINLELTAFPLNLKDLTNQATGNLGQLQNVGNQLK